ncbi:Protein FAR1-RELATED SEQUENCE 4 [Sesbania bispinosa]|nr:Protein FAR1-RELATED SEQUENCE 4 [Sesbania bispinosa]
MGSRYKDICRMQAQIPRKAAITEEAYNIDVNGLTKFMIDIDACLEGKDMDANATGVSPINPENVLCSGSNNSVRGIKTKERYRGTSSRPKGVLERKRKKKAINPNESSLHNLDVVLPSSQSSQRIDGNCLSTEKETTGDRERREDLNPNRYSFSRDAVMAELAPEGSQFDGRQYDTKMNELLTFDGQDFFTSYDEVYDSFDAMGLQENLLRGIYAYGRFDLLGKNARRKTQQEYGTTEQEYGATAIWKKRV